MYDDSCFKYQKIFSDVNSPLRESQPTIVDKNNVTNDKVYRKVAILMYMEMSNFRPQAEKQLQNQNHTEDWALGFHPRDNGHVTH